MHRFGGLIWGMITEEKGVACHTCYDAFKKHKVNKPRTENEDPIRWARPKSFFVTNRSIVLNPLEETDIQKALREYLTRKPINVVPKVR